MIEATASVDIDAPAASAWAVVADYRLDPLWRRGVEEMRPTPAGLVVPGTTTVERMRFAGRAMRNDGVVRTVEPGSRFEWRTTTGVEAEGSRSVVPLGPRRCRVDLVLRVRLRGLAAPAGPLLRRGLRADAARLATLVEARERRPGFDTAGTSTHEIGRAMGVTTQAQKRFVPRTAEEDLGGGLYTRFTPRAQNTVLAAQQAALRLQAPEVTTEHLVLGLLTEPRPIAGEAFRRLGGGDLDRIREAVEAATGPAVDTPPSNPPFSSGARKALDLTRREALRMGHNYIGTEHLLLGILSDPADPADPAATLARLGVEHAATETFVHEALAAVIAAREPS
ncbi:MAG: SRPBCC family protein [Pseudonocardia sp.]|uniref:Clp protease N-terminal domain-containing protein n=1 Tax=unclassified Pseudonocardia TaxID=2619320 RepID=UPI000B200497|nr:MULTISPECIES: Clp protease N-terminal domain-containing protein [unclassified Pseudonocardia]MBN9110064.1 SRPBCC family protein [Pseudonocardia sp.]